MYLIIWERAKQLILNPHSTWDEIALETTTISQLYQNYLFLLAIIPSFAGFWGWLFHGINIFQSLVWSIFHYVLLLAMIWIAARFFVWIALGLEIKVKLDTMVILFGYSVTPLILAGIFLFIPAISFLVLIGIYSVFVLYIGIDKIILPPPKKLTLFTTIAALTLVISYIVVLGFTMNFSRMPALLP